MVDFLRRGKMPRNWDSGGVPSRVRREQHRMDERTSFREASLSGGRWLKDIHIQNNITCKIKQYLNLHLRFFYLR